MNDIVGIGGYLAVAVALLLLVVAGLLRERPAAAEKIVSPEPPRRPESTGVTRQNATESDKPPSLAEAEQSRAPAAAGSSSALAATAPDAVPACSVSVDAPAAAGDAGQSTPAPAAAAVDAAVGVPAVATANAPAARSVVGARRLGWPSTASVRGLRGLTAGVLLAVLSVALAARLWDVPVDLAPLWWLLTTGAAFALLASLMLGWTDADRDEHSPSETVTRASERPTAAQLRVRAGVLTVASALLIEVGSIALFSAGRLLSIAWMLHLAATVVLVFGLWQGARPGARALVAQWTPADTFWILALSLIGLVLRVWRIESVPEGLWFDEAQRGLEALRMLAEPTYRPIFAAGILQEPTGLWFFMMPLISWLGRDPVALRLPVALGGALGIAAIYLLARVMYGRRVAVAAAGLLIALAWHLNFSRIALPAVLSLTCDTLAAALFVAGLRRNSGFLLGTAGVVGGAGLYFYYTSQLMPFVLIIGAGQQLLASRLRSIRSLAVGLALFGLGFMVAAGPFVFYAATNWERFSARAGAVSVFREVEAAGSYQPLINNIKSHLLMFHVKGDPNGRHNWSGRPMLDAVTGGLAVLGLAMALGRLWRLEQTLLLVWIPAALSGGIFSLTWEAPQSHRAIGAIVPVVLLAALPLGLLWQRADAFVAGFHLPSVAAGRQRWLALASTAAVVLVLCGADIANANRYFTRQIRDPRTWMEFTTPQTEAGRQAAALPPDMKVYLEPSWVGHPSVRFVDGSNRQYAPFEPSLQLPITDAQAAIFIGERPHVAERIAALYPSAIRSYTRVPENGNTVGFGFILPQAIVQETRGVLARYQGPGGAVERRETTLSQNWPEGAPVAPPFEASWSTTLTVPAFNTYRLKLEGPPSVVLTLDGTEILRGGNEGSLKLARGNHAIRIAGADLGKEPVQLLWAQQNEAVRPIPANLLNTAPVQTTGLLGRVYRGEDLTAEPLMEQVDPNVELVVHTLPTGRPYTLEWTGALRADKDGKYRIGVSSLGTAAIWVDGEQVAVNTTPGGSTDGEVTLTRGWHDIRVRFVDSLGFSFVNAFWQPPDSPRTVIPSSVLRPWPAYRVVAARPEDADQPAPTAPVADETAPRIVPIVPPETARDRRPIGEGRVLTSSGALLQPRGLAVAPDGSVYVADGGRAGVVRLAADGSSRLLGEGKLKEPSAVALLDDGLAVVDAGAGMVLRMSFDGEIGERLFKEYPLYGPRGLTSTRAGDLVLADTGNDRLIVRKADGTVQVVTGLSQPTSGAMLADGTFIAAEVGANRIVQVQADGKRLTTWTMPQSVTVNGPHVAVLPDGGWLVSLPEERALMARPAGADAATLWTLGNGMRKPTGLGVGPSGVYVVDIDGKNVQAFNLP